VANSRPRSVAATAKRGSRPELDPQYTHTFGVGELTRPSSHNRPSHEGDD